MSHAWGGTKFGLVRPNLDQWVARLGNYLPAWWHSRLLRLALGERRVALCLHRVSDSRRPTDWQPSLTISPAELDALIELLLDARPRTGERWLTVSFDDGYEDAAAYVESRAARFPTLEFLFFVCPEKTASAVGFRWDLVEERTRKGESLGEATASMGQELDVLFENGRGDLREVARLAQYRLADAEQVRRLQRLANVVVGNHTNCHYKQTTLTDEQARLEYRRSLEEFTRLFGPQAQFAFPFGTPRHEFDERHVRLLREQGDFLIWTTERRPYDAFERGPGAVLPRFPVNGTWNHRQLAAWIAARSLIYRLRGGATFPR